MARRCFEALAPLANAAGPPDVARLKEIMLRHGPVPV